VYLKYWYHCFQYVEKAEWGTGGFVWNFLTGNSGLEIMDWGIPDSRKHYYAVVLGFLTIISRALWNDPSFTGYISL
jgi:hypothetical protein